MTNRYQSYVAYPSLEALKLNNIDLKRCNVSEPTQMPLLKNLEENREKTQHALQSQTLVDWNAAQSDATKSLTHVLDCLKTLQKSYETLLDKGKSLLANSEQCDPSQYKLSLGTFHNQLVSLTVDESHASKLYIKEDKPHHNVSCATCQRTLILSDSLHHYRVYCTPSCAEKTHTMRVIYRNELNEYQVPFGHSVQSFLDTVVKVTPNDVLSSTNYNVQYYKSTDLIKNILDDSHVFYVRDIRDLYAPCDRDVAPLVSQEANAVLPDMDWTPVPEAWNRELDEYERELKVSAEQIRLETYLNDMDEEFSHDDIDSSSSEEDELAWVSPKSIIHVWADDQGWFDFQSMTFTEDLQEHVQGDRVMCRIPIELKESYQQLPLDLQLPNISWSPVVRDQSGAWCLCEYRRPSLQVLSNVKYHTFKQSLGVTRFKIVSELAIKLMSMSYNDDVWVEFPDRIIDSDCIYYDEDNVFVIPGARVNVYWNTQNTTEFARIFKSNRDALVRMIRIQGNERQGINTDLRESFETLLTLLNSWESVDGQGRRLRRRCNNAENVAWDESKREFKLHQLHNLRIIGCSDAVRFGKKRPRQSLF